ncbi:Thiol:disulfide interchange protein DsbA precursor [Pseudoalteromonas sp. THAF3]|uniref:thiol:disulfide interchange protein DsbA/DsbL n=1 Tax=Pseudoalteromonas TaxID=53246 RepID=UPI0003461E9C|nr:MULTISPECIES: thiol:disulfide interchange protein DsbA/DsbL [Pseudoalteromonas]MCG7544760.1 thiol:disulfide interchange protein DsbA/DsbL [Pseudoalteromonas sp. MM17-2]MCG7567464.1 thiol:disulfide interchange protein DsbA/DsbL [Pseudoalteromonas sp. CnMc7-15]QFU06079.1 Thiol:disulfide interchange protein DsbA precursor [Pseudoalteromonas sp. THAF3]GAP74371.1 periplasmic thiol:disulfide interchange protein DsbA [Pseudoalteromonas sp. SW0106-04]
MKKFIALAMMALALPISAIAAQFEEGTHYEVVSDRASRKPEVKEFFSFYCPACNAYEGLLMDVKPKLSKDVDFKKSHVNFMGGRSTENQDMLSQALATAEVLPQKDKLIAAMFSHIHTKRAKFNEVADVKDIFVANGVDGDKFDKLFKGFAIRTKASKMQRDQEYFKEKGALRGVPTFIVNGKYRLLLGRESGVTDPEDIAALINFLAKK